jgi:hypothetical protein
MAGRNKTLRSRFTTENTILLVVDHAIDKVLTYSRNGSYPGRIHASIVNVPTKSADAIMPSPDCELMTIAHRDPAKPPFIS